MRISDWSSDVCSSDLVEILLLDQRKALFGILGTDHRGTGHVEHVLDDAAVHRVIFDEEDVHARPSNVRAGCFGTELIPARLSSHAAWDTTAPSRNSVSWRPDMGNRRSRSAVPPIGLSMTVSTPISPGAISCAMLAHKTSTVDRKNDV